MKKFVVTLGNSGEKFVVESDSLTMDDVLLMVAEKFGEEWYGCSVSCGKDFICNAVKDYYSYRDSDKTVYEWALISYVNKIKIANGMYTTKYDWHDDCEVYCPNENVFKSFDL